MWNIEKIVSKGDYNYAIVREHPNRTKNNYVLLHRIIIENHLGRLLNTNEVVHHINGDKKDNRIDNLQVLSAVEHGSLHSIERSIKNGKRFVDLICPNCNIKFTRHYRQTHLGKKCGRYTTCSRSCSGKLSRKIQLQGITIELKLAISVNIVSIYMVHDNTEQTY